MASWQRSGGLLLERVELRQVNLPLPLHSPQAEETCPPPHLLALSAYGGPIAMFSSAEKTVKVFASGGKWLASFQFPCGPCEGGFGWTHDLALVFVCDDADGSVFIWDDFVGLKPRRLKLKFGTKVLMATIWRDSIIALTSKMGVLVMSEIRSKPNIKWQAVVFPMVNPPRSICVLMPDVATDSTLEIAAALPDQAGMLVASPERKSVDARVPQFRALPSRLLSPHPTEPIIASLDVSDRLLVMNLTLEEIIFARDCQLGQGFESVPSSLSWCLGGAGYCLTLLWEETPWAQESSIVTGSARSGAGSGEDAVAEEEEEVRYGPGALVVGFLPPNAAARPSEDHQQQQQSVARFSFESPKGPVFAISEVDGVRVYCAATKRMHLIRRVSKSTQAVDAIGSLSPAAILLEMVDDELALAGMDEEDLVAAADDLMDCAKFEPDLSRRLELLRAAQVAKDRIADESRIKAKARLARKFTEVCSTIRALQFLSEAQLTSATYIQAIAVGLFAFASRIAYLGFPREAKAIARLCQLNTHAFDVIEARMAAFIALSRSASNGPSSPLTAEDVSASRTNNAMGMMSKALFPKQGSSFIRSDCAASLGLSVALQQNADSTAAKDVLLRLAELESRFSCKLIYLLQMQEIDRVLTLLDTSRGIDFDLKARTALYCLSRAATPQQQERIAQHIVAEQAVRASLKSMGNAEQLEKWLITVATLRDRRAQALQDRALLLAETAMFSSDLAVDPKKKAVLLQEAAREFDVAGKPFYATQAREYLELLALQSEFPLTSRKSIVELIQDCVARGRDDVAERLRKQFKVAPHLFWRAKIRGMGKRGVWVEAARLVTLQKEVSRWVKVEDVVEMCFDAGADAAASRIAFEVLEETDPERARTFVRLRLWKEALQSAIKSRCVDALEAISYQCRDVDISKKASETLEDIKKNPGVAGASGDVTGSLFGMMAGAVHKVEPQRCQQQ